jgi:DNA-binding HxlR family transcriptional regulator
MLAHTVSAVNQVPMSNYQSTDAPRATRARPDAFVAVCPSRAILARLGEKWALLAIAALVAGPQHFGELRRRLQGISQKMLTQTLRALERDGLVQRKVLDTRPIRVEYSLTALGTDFARHAIALKSWVEAHLQPVERRQDSYDRTRAR